jgi:4-amino-4-deoxy-L-arabinose transferase-like glycosyltransferase
MPGLQEWIHKLEVGAGTKYLKVALAVLTFAAIALAYNLRGFKNFQTAEAMDVAQVARNVSEGHGYSTLFIRPLSVHLLEKHQRDAKLKEPFDHPDLANPPVYPTLLAAAMKVLPFKFKTATTGFRTYQPERLIAIINQLLFFGLLLGIFWLAKRLFDSVVAWTSMAVLAGAEIFWRFSVSGLSTILLSLILIGVVVCLVLIEQRERRETLPSVRGTFALAILAGCLIGLGALTRYSFGWLLLPVLLFLALCIGRIRAQVCLAVAAACLVVMAPWLVRNYQVSGTLFGTASYTVYEHTPPFPGQGRVERSLDPEQQIGRIGFADYARKLLLHVREIMQEDLPKLGGSWVSGFFLAALLIPFASPTLSRLRLFLAGSLMLFVVVQAIGTSRLTGQEREMTSENLLVIFAPLVFIYGVALFFILLDQFTLPMQQLRYTIVGLFVTIVSAPLIFALLPPKTQPVAYPPYYPPMIQESAGWLKEKEMMMSDVPWAVAWYGQRQCAALTLGPREEFLKLDDLKPVKAIYLSPQTMDGHFGSQLLKDKDGWGYFVIELIMRGDVPKGFPLRILAGGFLPDQLFLTDWERWKATPK